MGGACIACDPGLECRRGARHPILSAGFWQPAGLNSEAVVCDPPAACLGGLNSTCRDGHVGRACGSCNGTDYYKDAQTRLCEVCDEDTGSYWIMIAAAAVVLFALALPILARVPADGSRHPAVVLPSIAMAVTWLQVLALVGTFSVDWPYHARRVFTIASAAYLNSDLAQLPCALPAMTYYEQWRYEMMVPIVFGIFYLVVFGFFAAAATCCSCGAAGTRGERIARGGRVIFSGYLFFVTMVYVFAARATLSFFNCIEQETGVFVLASSRANVCYEEDWDEHRVIGIVGMALYVAGIPLTMLGLLVWARFRPGASKHGHGTGNEAVRHFGLLNFATRSYTGRFFWWELTVFLRKLLVVAAALFLVERGQLQVCLPV